MEEKLHKDVVNIVKVLIVSSTLLKNNELLMEKIAGQVLENTFELLEKIPALTEYDLEFLKRLTKGE